MTPLRNQGALVRYWRFVRSPVTWRTRLARLHAAVTGLRPAPRHKLLKPCFIAPRWSVYFMYVPEGIVHAAHYFTLNRLKARGVPLLVVIATQKPENIPDQVWSIADALAWKSLSGFDFSAYTIALHELASSSPECEALVMNDSVLGPFNDLDALFAETTCDLVGFTGYGFVENHIQSYAFLMRGVSPARMSSLRTVFPKWASFDGFKGVVYCQETRFARIASRAMRVGALWYGTREVTGDPTLLQAAALLEQGFPFLKKSLFGKFAGVQDEEALRAFLERQEHPRFP